MDVKINIGLALPPVPPIVRTAPPQLVVVRCTSVYYAPEVAAIQTAVATYPGRIQEVEVEREGRRVIVEVDIISADGRKIAVRVDPATNAVMR